VWTGELRVLDTIWQPTVPYYADIDRAITKYPYDQRMSEQLMTEAGYTKGPDGIYVSPTEGRLTFPLIFPQNRREPPVLAANWRQAGFDIKEIPLSSVEERDPEVRGSYGSLYIQASGLTEVQQMARYRTSEVSTPETRWRGENVTGWRNPVYDQLVDAFTVTLDQNERVRQRAQIAKIFSDDVPAIPLTENPNPFAYLSRVKNITNAPAYLASGRMTWNIEKW